MFETKETTIKTIVTKQPPIIKVGVGVVIYRQFGEESKILLGLRKGAHGEGTWSPPGGHLEWGETFEECAKRKVKEKTTLDIKILGQIYTTSDHFFQEQLHYVTVFIKAEWWGGNPKITDPDKCEEWYWWNPKKLPAELFLPFQQLVKNGNLR